VSASARCRIRTCVLPLRRRSPTPSWAYRASVPSGIRTQDLRFRRPALVRAELRGLVERIVAYPPRFARSRRCYGRLRVRLAGGFDECVLATTFPIDPEQGFEPRLPGPGPGVLPVALLRKECASLPAPGTGVRARIWLTGLGTRHCSLRGVANSLLPGWRPGRHDFPTVPGFVRVGRRGPYGGRTRASSLRGWRPTG
jgi:hypothetical protein